MQVYTYSSLVSSTMGDRLDTRLTESLNSLSWCLRLDPKQKDAGLAAYSGDNSFLIKLCFGSLWDIKHSLPTFK